MTDWSLTRDGSIAELTFSHPPHHTIDHAGIGELERHLAHLAADDVRVVIVTGGAPDVFIAHAELSDLAAMAAGQPTSGDPGAWPRALRLLDRGPFVTIAAINGRAWGGGLELALSCTLRVADHSSTFCFPEIAIGIVPAVATHRLMAAVSENVALELLLLAQPFDAPRAHHLGLVTHVVPDGTTLDAARSMARRLVGFAPSAVDAVRELVLGGRDHDERERRRHQQTLFSERLADPITRPLVDAAVARRSADPAVTFDLDGLR